MIYSSGEDDVSNQYVILFKVLYVENGCHLFSSCFKVPKKEPTIAYKSIGVQVDIRQPSSLPSSSTSPRLVSSQTSDVNASNSLFFGYPVLLNGESLSAAYDRRTQLMEEEMNRKAKLHIQERKRIAMEAIVKKLCEEKRTSFIIGNVANSGLPASASQIQIYTHDPDYEEAECSTYYAYRGSNYQKPGLGDLNDCLGPVPPEGSSVFSSANFILIKGASDLCDRCCKHVERQIRCGNGRVYNNFVSSDQDSTKDSTKMLLINNGPLKEKASLILAICRGIQLLKIDYIKKMTLNMAPDINEFIVTKMYSVSKKEEITIYPRVMKKLLTNSVIAIACVCNVADLNYVKDIIVALGGRYFNIFKERVEGPVICVMSDICCVIHAKRFGHEFGIPAVGLKWLTQSVINNELTGFSLYHL